MAMFFRRPRLSLGLSLVFVYLVSGLSPAWAKRNSATARDVLAKYLAADFAGSRIMAQTEAATAKAVTWTEEPPWDQVVVVARYSIVKVKSKRKATKVTVQFENLGELKGEVYFPDPVKEETTFDVVRKFGSWKVDRPILVPHISVASAQKYLQEQLKKLEPNSEKRKDIDRSLELLRKTSR